MVKRGRPPKREDMYDEEEDLLLPDNELDLPDNKYYGNEGLGPAVGRCMDGPDDDMMLENIQDYYPDGSGGLTASQKHPDLLKELTSFGAYMRETMNDWLGLKWDEEAQRYVRDQNIVPIMNLKCAIWCISHMKTYARPNNIITHIRKEEYANMMYDVIHELWFNIGTRKKDFGIRHNGDVLKICNKLEHSAELVLMGAGDGKYSDLLTHTYTHHTQESQAPYNPYQQQQMMPSAKRTTFFGKLKKVMFGGAS